MKKLVLLILFLLNLLLLQAQEVKFISVNQAVDTFENINFKRLPKLLEKDTLTADTLAEPSKWMAKLSKKLSRGQRKDSNIYIFFVPDSNDSARVYLPLSGKYGYVIFDSTKTGAYWPGSLVKKLRTHKYQWEAIHDPKNMLFAWAQDEEEGAKVSFGIVEKIDESRAFVKLSDVQCHTFFTPAGKPISFSQEDKLVITDLDFESITEKGITVPKGALFKFKLNEVRYRAHYKSDPETGKWMFEGYKKDGEEHYYKENITKTYKAPYKINLFEDAQLITSDTEWDLNSPHLFASSETSDYSATGFIVDEIVLRPCGALYDKYYPVYSKSHVLKVAIDKDPCCLMGMRPYGEGLGYESEFMKGLNAMVNAGLYVALFPAAIEILAPIIISNVEVLGAEFVKALGEKMAQKKLTDFAKGAAFDATIQAFTLHVFDDVPLEYLHTKLDYAQMAITGAENTIDDKWGKIIADAVSPLYDAFTEDGYFKEDLNMQSFVNDYAIALFVNIAFDKLADVDGLNHSLMKIKTIFAESPKKFVDGLNKLDIPETTKAGIISNLRKVTGQGSKMPGVDHIINRESISGIFNEIKSRDGNSLRAGNFWKKSGDDIVHYISSGNKYYLKHDPTTNEVLFYDIENNVPLGYYLDEYLEFATKEYKPSISNNYEEVVSGLEKLHKGGTFKNTSTGKSISSIPGKTTTILGSYIPDTKQIIDELGRLKSCNFSAKQGGFNVLNVPDHYYKDGDQFWNEHNKPFLDEAIKRSDNIVLATAPTLNRRFKTNELGDYIDLNDRKIELDYSKNIEEQLLEKGVLTGFGKEIEYLKKAGFTLDEQTYKMVK